ncbi:hypothetical protein ACJX0J_009995, partial [Zea mays]
CLIFPFLRSKTITIQYAQAQLYTFYKEMTLVAINDMESTLDVPIYITRKGFPEVALHFLPLAYVTAVTHGIASELGENEGGWDLEDLELPPETETPKAVGNARSALFKGWNESASPNELIEIDGTQEKGIEG